MVIANSNSNTTLVSFDGIDNGHNKKHNNVVIDETGLLRYVEATGTNVTSRCNDNEGESENVGDDCCCGGSLTGLLISVLQPTTESKGKGESPSFVPLYLPTEENRQGQHQQSSLSSLSLSFNDNVDEYLSQNYYNTDTSNWLPGSNVLKDSRDRLLGLKSNGGISTPIRFFGDSSKQLQQQQRLLYVAQGERGNATTQQYDVIMSDKATT